MRLTILSALFFIATSLHAQQFLNSDFEHWNSNTEAKHWNSINDLIVMPGVVGFQKTSDANSGQFAGMLTTVEEFGMLIPGVVTKGTVTMGNVAGGVPFAFRPDRFKAYYKHPTSGNPQLHLILTKFQNGLRDTVGYGFFYPASQIDSYTLLEVSIQYYTNEVPDSINIVVLTDHQTVGDTLYIDDMEFEYISGINEYDETQMMVYPNPSNGLFYSNIPVENDLFVFNMQGQKVAVISKGSTQMNLEYLPVGMYMLINEKGKFVSKLSIY